MQVEQVQITWTIDEETGETRSEWVTIVYTDEDDKASKIQEQIDLRQGS